MDRAELQTAKCLLDLSQLVFAVGTFGPVVSTRFHGGHKNRSISASGFEPAGAFKGLDLVIRDKHPGMTRTDEDGLTGLQFKFLKTLERQVDLHVAAVASRQQDFG